MTTLEQIAAEVEARERADKDEPFSAAHEGAQMLDELWLGLQRSAARIRHAGRQGAA